MNDIDIDIQNKAFYWASLFIEESYACGVRHAVISPGSRSTPLTVAAASHPKMDTRVILDERSAAFTALGIGKATGVPAMLICTSGTAAANYLPAVVESKMSGIPLIVATADRPPYMRSTGANQAIDQIKIFGNYPVFFHEVGEPVLEKQDMERLRALAVQAVEHSSELHGPVHLNFPFRKPLEPDPEFIRSIAEQQNKYAGRRNPATVSLHGTGRVLELPETVKKFVNESKRPLIVAGPLAPFESRNAIDTLSRQTGAPLLAEYGSGADSNIFHFDGFLRDEMLRRDLEPDLILRFGYQPTAKAVNRCLKEWNHLPHFHFASPQNHDDATFSSTHRLQWDGKSGLNNFFEIDCTKGWLEDWKSAEQAFNKKIEHYLENADKLTDGHIYSKLTPGLPESWQVMLSSSFPVRDALLFGRIRRPCYANRGASGIDGITSTAMGLTIGTGRPSVLFTGDLAFFHDINALLNRKILDAPLLIVVLNNGGGTIFRMLPIADHEDMYTHYFETPQEAGIEHLARSFNAGYTRIDQWSTLKNLDLSSLAEKENPLQVIECKTDPGASMKIREQLWNIRLP